MGDLESLRSEYVRLRSASAELQSSLAKVETACAQAVLELGEAGRNAGELLQSAESKLHKSEQLLTGIFEGALDAMLLVGEDYRYVDANPAAMELFGLSKEEIIGRSF